MRIHSLPIRIFCAVLCLCGCSSAQRSQRLSSPIDLSIEKAGAIFAGTVLQVEAPNAAHEYGLVVFRVSDGIRGVSTGDEFTLREWAGLWTTAAARYRVGDSLVMLLYKPGLNGLSSPVGGDSGRIHYATAATLKLSSQQILAVQRSIRLGGSLSQDGAAPKTIRAADFLAALRSAAAVPTP